MASFSGTLRFCDPYVESASLNFLAEARAVTEIRLLTVNISKPQVFARTCPSRLEPGGTGGTERPSGDTRLSQLVGKMRE